MVCWPAEVKLKLALVMPLLLVVSVPWPMLVDPSKKITEPVGLPGPFPLTVAVKVTTWPDTEGLAEETTTVLVLAIAWKARIPSTSLRPPPEEMRV